MGRHYAFSSLCVKRKHLQAKYLIFFKAFILIFLLLLLLLLFVIVIITVAFISWIKLVSRRLVHRNPFTLFGRLISVITP